MVNVSLQAISYNRILGSGRVCWRIALTQNYYLSLAYFFIIHVQYITLTSVHHHRLH